MGNELSKNPFEILYDLATEAVDFTVNFTLGIPFQLIDPTWKPFGDYTPGHLQLGGLDQDWKTALEDTATLAIAVVSGNPVFMAFATTQGMADLTGVKELGLQNDLNLALGDRAGMYVGFAAQIAGGYEGKGAGTTDMISEKIPEQIEMTSMAERSKLQPTPETAPAPTPAMAPIEYHQSSFQANNGPDTFRPSQAYSRSRMAEPGVDLENKYNRAPQEPTLTAPEAQPSVSLRQRLAEKYQSVKQRVSSWYRARNTREPNVVYTRIPESELNGVDRESEMRSNPLGDLPELRLDENPPIIQLEDKTNALDEPFPQEQPKASDRVLRNEDLPLKSLRLDNVREEQRYLLRQNDIYPVYDKTDFSHAHFDPYEGETFRYPDNLPRAIPSEVLSEYRAAIVRYKMADRELREYWEPYKTQKDFHLSWEDARKYREAQQERVNARKDLDQVRKHVETIRSSIWENRHQYIQDDLEMTRLEQRAKQRDRAEQQRAAEDELRRSVITQDVNDALRSDPRTYNAEHWKGLGDQAKSIGNVDLARKAYAAKTALNAIERRTMKEIELADLRKQVKQADAEFGSHQNPQRWLQMAQRASKLGDVELSRYAHAKKTALNMVERDRMQTIEDIKQVAQFQADQLPEPVAEQRAPMVLDTPENFGLRQRHARAVNAVVADSVREVLHDAIPQMMKNMQGAQAANHFGEFVDTLAGRNRVFSYNTDYSTRMRYNLNRIAYFIQNQKFAEAKAELHSIVKDPAFSRYGDKWNISLEQTQLAVQKALNNALDPSLKGVVSNDSHAFLQQFATQLFELEFDREGHVSPYETRRMWWTLLRRTFQTGLYLHPQRASSASGSVPPPHDASQPEQGLFLPMPQSDPDYALPDPYIDQTVQMLRLVGRLARSVGPLYAWYAKQQLEQVPYDPMPAYGEARPASALANLSHPQLKRRRLLPVSQH